LAQKEDRTKEGADRMEPDKEVMAIVRKCMEYVKNAHRKES